MLSDFRAVANLRAGQVDLTWTWTGRERPLPAWRLVRARRGYPIGPDTGAVLLDLDDTFRPSIPFPTPWQRIEQIRAVVPNAVKDDGMCQAELRLYFDPADADQPSEALIAWYDPSARRMLRTVLRRLSRVTREVHPSLDHETFELYAAGEGGEERRLGTLRIVLPRPQQVGRFEWNAVREDPVSVTLDRLDRRNTIAQLDEKDPRRLQLEVAVVQEGQELPRATLKDRYDPDSGSWTRTVHLQDQGLEAKSRGYYALFLPDPEGGSFYTEFGWRAAAAATGHYGLEERLYRLLPGVHKDYDHPPSGEQEKGQLQRFLSVFGAALDHVRSSAEGLAECHDLANVRADLLPPLGHLIGWETDQRLDTLTQRRRILEAPKVYGTTGTRDGIRALVFQETGWDCEIKEYAHNVFLSNAPDACDLWEIWSRDIFGPVSGDAVPVTRSDGFDGRPAVVAPLLGRGAPRLFWHRNGPRGWEIWMQSLHSGGEPSPVFPAETRGAAQSDQYPAVIRAGNVLELFWSSNRAGQWDIWTSKLRGTDASAIGEAINLTDHPSHDTCPAAIVHTTGEAWLFWSSNRRGLFDIWCRRRNEGGDWDPPELVTGPDANAAEPAAAYDDAGRIWLFWSADLGDRKNIHYSIRGSDGWSEPKPVTTGRQRDESPAVLFDAGKLWLFWHSNRGGRWRIWHRMKQGRSWSKPAILAHYPTADKEPSLLAGEDDGLRVFWRSQRRGERLKSRTLDCSDPEMLAGMGTLADRVHYSYDMGEGDADRYARDRIGIYVRPNIFDFEAVGRAIERLRSELTDYLPINIRPILVVDWPANPVQ